ncbi:tetratricopeptide repeat protein [Candidatus Neomarinimicrobiota bacterium]
MRTSSIISAITVILTACSNQQSAFLDKPVALFYEYKIDQALPLFQAAVKGHPDDATATAYLAETYRRTGQDSLARVIAKQALLLDPCQGLAHVTLAYLDANYTAGLIDYTTHPEWDHLNQRLECDSTNGNHWLGKWGEGEQRSDRLMVELALRKLVETGFLTPAALAYGRWMLATLPDSAILLTNGDMDTFPPEALQVVEHYRTDVTILYRGQFNYAWGIKYYQDALGVELGVSGAELAAMGTGADYGPMDQKILAHLATSASNGSRPLAFAPTVDPDFYAAYADRLADMGAYLLFAPTPVTDNIRLSAIEASIAAIDPDRFVGPWASEQDYSPVRRHYTRRGARNITNMALEYCTSLIELHRYPDARATLDWVAAFEEKTELGHSFQERVAELEGKLGE